MTTSIVDILGVVEININPVEGLKHSYQIIYRRINLVEININPVEGLKQVDRAVVNLNNGGRNQHQPSRGIETATSPAPSLPTHTSEPTSTQSRD